MSLILVYLLNYIFIPKLCNQLHSIGYKQLLNKKATAVIDILIQ